MYSIPLISFVIELRFSILHFAMIVVTDLLFYILIVPYIMSALPPLMMSPSTLGGGGGREKASDWTVLKTFANHL